MGQFTPNLNLYKAGGGSTGLITPDEVADIDKAVNDNFDKLDTWAGEVEDKLTLPDPVSVSGGETVNVSATTWSSLSGVFVTLNLPKACWVEVDGAAWLVCNGGIDLRCSWRASGDTTIDELAGNWGSTLYTSASDSDGSVQRSFPSRKVKLNAGETTIQMRAQQAGGGTKQVNHAFLQVSPFRWAD